MTEKRAPQGGKAGWTVLVVFVPLIGVLIYVAVHRGVITDAEFEREKQKILH